LVRRALQQLALAGAAALPALAQAVMGLLSIWDIKNNRTMQPFMPGSNSPIQPLEKVFFQAWIAKMSILSVISASIFCTWAFIAY